MAPVWGGGGGDSMTAVYKGVKLAGCYEFNSIVYQSPIYSGHKENTDMVAFNWVSPTHKQLECFETGNLVSSS